MWENPIPRAAPRAMMAPIIEPDCETKASRPGSSVGASQAAFTVQAMPAFRFITPMEFGPSRRSPARRAVASSRACSAWPSGPASAKPSARMQAAGMPLAATASITPSTCGVLSRI